MNGPETSGASQETARAGPTSYSRLPGEPFRTGPPMVCYKNQRFFNDLQIAP